MSAVTSKATPELFPTIAAGDRVMLSGAIYGREEWATITDIEFVTVKNYAGVDLVREAVLTVHSAHWTSYDSWGWPISKEDTRRVTVRRYSEDVRHAYTPAA